MDKIKIIGGGFAGVEAAWQLAERGIESELYEMKPLRFSPAHRSEGLAELVCSNSFKAMRLGCAAGMLKAEMELLGSLCVACAKETAVPAGGALAVDRDKFSALVTEKILSRKEITLCREEVTEIPQGTVYHCGGTACLCVDIRKNQGALRRKSQLFRCGGSDNHGGKH